MRHIWIPFSVFVALLISCKSSKQLVSEFKERTSEELVGAISKHNMSFDWFACKAKIHFESSYESGRVSAHVRIKKDSLIWMNFKKFGLSMARLQIKPDSIYVVYPFEDYYERKPVEKFAELYGIDLQFDKIQSFLVGNALNPDPESIRITRTDENYELFGISGNYTVRYILNSLTLLLEEQSIIDTYGREVKIVYDNYSHTNGRQFYSHKRKYFAPIDENENGSAEISISEVEFNVPKHTPFNIPSHYETFDN